MTAIWLLSTRGRPREAQETVDACMDAGMTSPGVVYVDEDRGEYDRLRLPRNWRIHREPEWLSLQGSMQWCFNAYPDASQYGWLADDTRPRTRGWDRLLEEAAGDWCLSYARDLWFSEEPGTLDQLGTGNNLSSGLCWGGKLVRTVGWWALPGVIQAGIDTAWSELVKPLNLHRYRHDIVVEHLNWQTGKRKRDATDDWRRDGDDYVSRDIEHRNAWMWSGGYRDTLKRLAAAYTTNREAPPALMKALRQARADETYGRGGLSSGRLQQIMDGRFDEDDLLDIDAYKKQAPVGP